jgi:outer membrane protein assembly factor BamA
MVPDGAPTVYRWRRRLGLALILLVGATVLLYGVAHTAWVESRVLAAVLARLSPDGAIRVQRLEYELHSLRFRLYDVSMSDGTAAPYFEATEIGVDLPWSVLGGRLALEAVDIVDPVVNAIVNENGLSNLGDSATGYHLPLPIDSFVVDNLAIRWSDARGPGLGLSVDGLRVELAGADPGTVTGPTDAVATIGAERVELALRVGELAWDGRDLQLGQSAFGAAGAELRIDGTVGYMLGDRELDLDVALDLDPAELAATVGQPLDVEGSLSFAGRADGAASDAQLAGTVASERLRWQEHVLEALTARLRINALGMRIDAAGADIAGGHLNVEAAVAFGDDALNTATIGWDRLTGDLLPPDMLGVPVDLATTGSAAIRWMGLVPSLETAAIRADATVLPGVASTPAIRTRGSIRLILEPGTETVLTAQWSDLDLAGLPAAFGMPATATLAGAAAGSAELRWSGAVPGIETISGEIQAAAPAGIVEGFDVAGDLRASIDDGAWRARIEGVAPELGRVLADLTGNLQSESVGGAVEATVRVDSSVLEAWMPPTPAVDGTFKTRFEINGTLSAPNARGTLASESLVVGNERLRDVSTAFEARAGKLQLTELIIRGDGVDVSGGLAWDSQLAVLEGRVTGSLDNLGEIGRWLPASTAPLPKDLHGGLGFDVSFDGPLPTGNVAGTFAVTDAGAYGASGLAAVGRLSRVPSGTIIDEVVLELGANRARIGGSIGSDDELTDLLIDLDIVEFDRFPGAARLTSLQQVRSKIGISWDAARGQALVDLHELDIGLDGRRVIANQAGRIVVDADAIRVESLVLRSGATTAVVSGTLGTAVTDLGLRMQFAGDLGEFSEVANLAAQLAAEDPGSVPVLRLAGIVQGDLQVLGTRAEPRPVGWLDLAEASIAWDEAHAVTGIEGRLSVGAEGLALSVTRAVWRDLAMKAEGAVPWALLPWPGTPPAFASAAEAPRAFGGSLDVVADGLHLDFESVPEELRGAVLAARLRLDAAADELSMEALEGAARLEAFELRSPQLLLTQERPSVVSLRQQTLTFEDLVWTLADGSHQGRAELSGTAVTDGSRLDLNGTVDWPLAALSAMIPGVVLDGRLHGAVHLGGTSTTPETTGTLTLAAGSLAINDPRVAMSDIEGSFDFAGTSIRADDLRARVNGGDLTGFVALDFGNGTLPTGLAGVRVRSMVLQNRGARVLADADVTLSTSVEFAPRLFGEVRLLGGGYRSRRALATELLGLNAGTVVAPSAPTALDELQYDIRIRSADPLVLDTPYAQLGIAADIQLVGTYARPSLLGRATVVEGGRVRLAGNRYTVEQGAIDFIDPVRMVPILDLSARAQIAGEKITVTFTGDAFDPDVAATAESGLDSGDVLSLMATGRTLSNVGDAGQQVLTEQAFEVLTGQYLAGTARSLGFDSISFERSGGASDITESELFPRDTDFAARLTLARPIDDFFDLVYSQNLTNTDERSWVGILRLPYSLVLRVGTFDDGSRSAELQNTLTFGGAARATRSLTSRVGTVTLDGEIEPWRAQLNDLLQVRAGRDFDFLRWQDDRDRILARLHELGQLEARVRSTRSVPAEGVVDLVHSITPGPRTVLVIDGDIGTKGEAALREAWANALVDEFLVEDLIAAAREQLLQRGHANPRIDVRVVPTGGTTRAAVQVTAGPRYRVRPAALSGNQSITSTEILERVKLAMLPAHGWIRPEAVTEIVLDLYQQRGWLEAVVQTRGPIVTESDARLEVTIAEGAPYVLSALSFTGNHELDEATLRARVATTAGQRWSRDVLDGAILAVTNAYLERGHNSVRVQPELAIDSNTAQVHLTLAIVEGPQQVLRWIEVEGLERIRRGVVDASLDLEIGGPMQLASVQAARRRLDSLGVFASVGIRVEPRGETDDGGQAVAAVVTVREQPAAVLRYGLQLFSEETLEDQRESQVGVAATARHAGLFGFAADAALTGRYRPDQRLLRGRIGFRRFFGLPINTNLIGELARRDEKGFFVTRITDTIATLEQSVSPLAGLRVGYAISAKRTRATLLTDFEVPQLDPVTSVRLVPTVVYDTRDDALAPRRGMFHSASYEWTPESLGSELLFRKLSTRHYGFLPLGPATFATAIRFGSGTSLDPTSDALPRSELFLAGGATSVRGYPDDSLGGTDFFGRFIPGGNAVLVLNQELRLPIWRWFQGVAFFDAGRAFPDLQSIRLGELKASVGGGLRLATPYLMLRLDYGIRLSDLEDFPDAPRGRFHFGIGHIF